MTILDIFKWGLEAVQRMHQDDDEVGSNGDHPRLLMERGMMDNCQSIYMIHSGIIALKAVIKPCSVISEHTLFFPYQWPSPHTSLYLQHHLSSSPFPPLLSVLIPSLSSSPPISLLRVELVDGFIVYSILPSNFSIRCHSLRGSTLNPRFRTLESS